MESTENANNVSTSITIEENQAPTVKEDAQTPTEKEGAQLASSEEKTNEETQEVSK